MCDVWNDMIPPPDGRIYINALGTVCMNYNTYCQIYNMGVKGSDNEDDFREWLREWLWKWHGK